MDVDYVVNFVGIFFYDGFCDINVDFNFGNFFIEELFGGNIGMVFDFGVVVKLDCL